MIGRYTALENREKCRRRMGVHFALSLGPQTNAFHRIAFFDKGFCRELACRRQFQLKDEKLVYLKFPLTNFS